MVVVFLACLLGAPNDCRIERIAFSAAPMPPALCARAAIPDLAIWAGEHPDREVSGPWTCERGKG